MRVLIAEGDVDLGDVWERHLVRHGHQIRRVSSETEAIGMVQSFRPQVIILDFALEGGNALAVSDFTAFRLPEAQVIFVTRDSFFSDGEVFSLVANACVSVSEKVPPGDLLALVDFYGARAGV